MLICHQCGERIDTTKPYAIGGEPGLMGGPKPPAHLGDCETMPVFVLPELSWPDRSKKRNWSVDTLKRRGWLSKESLGSDLKHKATAVGV